MTDIAVRDLGRRAYGDVWTRMRQFTDDRGADAADEIWLVEHPPVFTLGINADRSHLLMPGDVPVIATDRGGQVTYHGPGQIVCYPLLNVRRLGLGIRPLVELLEAAVIDTVARYGVTAYPRRDAPGVYVDARKLAAIGLRIRRGCSYHGLALNVAMDLAPFRDIHPCGFADLEVTQLRDLAGIDDLGRVRDDLVAELRARIEDVAARAA